jgi:glyoxylase-like metal-dependent hydrolase (beta-lactamase superfamily II)
MRVTQVAGNVYMLEGAGGNLGASVGDDGIVIVDDQYAPLAEKIQAALKGINDRPVRFIINTHDHGDHPRRERLLPEAGADHRTRQRAQAAGERHPRRQRRVDSF